MIAHLHRHGAVLLQSSLALGAIAALAVAPPASGDMLLLPLVPGTPVQRLAFESGATVIGTGRFGGVVVRGRRAPLAMRLLGNGVVPIAAPAILCGGSAAR